MHALLAISLYRFGIRVRGISYITNVSYKCTIAWGYYGATMRVVADIDDELGKRFRKAVIDIKGVKKGAVSEAIEEAIELWLSKYDG